MVVAAVLFDLDGTLLDTNYLHADASARAFLKVGRAIPRATIHRRIGKGADPLLPALLDDPSLHECASALHGEYYAAVLDQAYLLPGAAEPLTAVAARDIQAWLCTSAQPEELARLLPPPARGRLPGRGAHGVRRGDLHTRGRRVRGGAGAAAAVGDTIWDVEAARRARVRCVGGAYRRRAQRAELRAAGAVAMYADCAAALAAGFPVGCAPLHELPLADRNVMQGAGREQLLGLDGAVQQPLLEGVLQQRLDGGATGFQAVGPPVGA